MKQPASKIFVYIVLSIILCFINMAAVPVPQTPPPPKSPWVESYQQWASPPQYLKQSPGENAINPPELAYTLPNGPDPDNYNAMVFQNFNVYNGSYDVNWVYLASGNNRLIAGTSADEYYPRFDGSATRVVYVSDEYGSPDIYINHYTGADKRLVIYSPAVDTMPSFSHDGSKLAFVSDRTGNAEIFVSNSDGSAQTQLTSAPGTDVEPDWSVDSNHIVWARRSGNYATLMVMNADGSGQHAISAPLLYAGRPMWSPDGKTIAFQMDANGDGWLDLATIQADGTQLTPILLAQNVDYHFEYWMGSWSSTGKKIIFTKVNFVFDDGEYYINEAHIYGIDRQTLAWVGVDTGSGAIYRFNPDFQLLDQAAPEVKLQPIPQYSRANDVRVPFHIYDSSGLYSHWFETRSNPAGEWVLANPIVNSMCGTNDCDATAIFTGMPGTNLHIRLRSYDNAGNLTPDDPSKEVSTTLYLRQLTAQVADVREEPLEDVQVLMNPTAVNTSVTDENGLATVLTSVDGTLISTYAKTGYGVLPPQYLEVSADRSFAAILPPYDDFLVNGQFEYEAGYLSGWNTSGTLAVSRVSGISGNDGARIGNSCSDLLCLTPLTPLEDLAQYQEAVAHLGVDQTGRMNLITPHTHWILGADGTWQAANSLTVGRYGGLEQDPSGRLYTWRETPVESGAVLIQEAGGGWNEIAAPYYTAEVDVDGDGTIHALHHSVEGNGVYYSTFEPGGAWSTPIQLTSFYASYMSIAAAANGTVYFAFTYSDHAYRRELSADGVLGPLETLEGNGLIKFFRTADGALNSLYNNRLAKLLPDGTWSVPLVLESGGCDTLVGQVFGSDGSITKVTRCSSNYTDYTYVIYPPGNTHPLVFPFTSPNVGGVDMAIAPNGELHFIGRSSINSTTRRLLHSQTTIDATDQIGGISQSVTIPQDILSPTLSFFIRLNTITPASLARLNVMFTPQDGTPVTVCEEAEISSEWKHIWVDMEAFTGQSGELAFQLHQPEGEAWATVELDEISFGSWSTPTITSISPEKAPYPADEISFTIIGANFHSDAQVKIGGLQAVQTVWVSDGEVHFMLPESLTVGVHTVEVINPGGANDWLTIRIGEAIFLPQIRR